MSATNADLEIGRIIAKKDSVLFALGSIGNQQVSNLANA